MGTEKNPTVASFKAIDDPLERAQRCQQFLDNGRATLKAIQELRDSAIRQARAKRQGTIDEIAQYLGVKRNIIVQASRGAGVDHAEKEEPQ